MCSCSATTKSNMATTGDPMDMTNLFRLENELRAGDDEMTRKIEIERCLISELESGLQVQHSVISEKCEIIRKHEDDLKKLENRHQMAEQQLTNSLEMFRLLQGVVAEKEKKLQLVRSSREEMKKQLEFVLNTHRQKWEIFKKFYENMPETQIYLRVKSELIIAEEDMKSIKKTLQSLEDELKMLNTELKAEFYKRIVEMATLKCETIRTEKMIRDIIKSNRGRKNEEKPKNPQLTFPKLGFRTQFSNVFPATPFARQLPVPPKTTEMTTPASRDEFQSKNTEISSFQSEVYTPQLDLDAQTDNDQIQNAYSQSTVSSTISTPQFLSTNPGHYSQETSTQFAFAPSTSVAATQPFSFDFNEPSTTSSFPFNLTEQSNAPLRFQETPDEQPDTGFLSIFD